MNRLTLGIETSCDETAAAVYSSKHGVLSNELFSQIKEQKAFGGVVPEIASRTHLEKINGIVESALKTAGVTLDEIEVVAVTSKPGLPSALLVGFCFGKALAWVKQKKFIGINHLEGHAFSAFLNNKDIPFPHLCLTASGGHTALYYVTGFGAYKTIAHTIDDAAGEAFDKIARLIQLPYPGGPEIEQLAQKAGFKDYFNYPRGKKDRFNFSFSGLKTAVMYDLVEKDAYDMATKKFLKPHDLKLKEEVASSLLVCITDIFKQKIALALKEYPDVKALTFVGGVACNSYIREQLKEFLSKRNISLLYPAKQYCTDNAAMIAFVGNYKAERDEFSPWNLDILQ